MDQENISKNTPVPSESTMPFPPVEDGAETPRSDAGAEMSGDTMPLPDAGAAEAAGDTMPLPDTGSVKAEEKKKKAKSSSGKKPKKAAEEAAPDEKPKKKKFSFRKSRAAAVGDIAYNTVGGVIRLSVRIVLSVILVLLLGGLLFACIFAYYVKNNLTTDLNITLSDYAISLSSTIWAYNSDGEAVELAVLQTDENREIGRASCRERV